MLDLLIEKFHDPQFMTMVLAAIAASATVYTLVTPFFAAEGLTKRMKAVASERERIRQRERERLAKSEKVSLRQAPKQFVSRIVEDLNLGKWVAQEAAREKLVMAGYRGHAPYVTFLFFRMITPIVMLIGATVYVFLLSHMQQSTPIKAGICIGAAFLGLQAPMLFLKNAIAKRQLSIKRAFPDALDLLLICIESGMSIEVAFRKVSTEIGSQSVALAEEFTLTTAELSYLQDRKVAYENLAKRTGLEGVKSVMPRAPAVGAIRHSARAKPSRDGAGKPRHAHVGGREEGGRPAAQADSSDDRVLPARAVRGHPGTVGHQDRGPYALRQRNCGTGDTAGDYSGHRLSFRSHEVFMTCGNPGREHLPHRTARWRCARASASDRRRLPRPRRRADRP